MVRSWIIGLVALMVCLAGCGKKTDVAASPELEPGDASLMQTDAIAVIDLNVVAQEIGARNKINESLLQRESELVDQLNGFRSELERRVEEKLAEFGSDLNDQRQSDLDKTVAENQSKVNLQAQAAQSQLAAHHARLKQQLLDQIRPVAFRVARTRGLSIVMTTSQVYAAAPERDITQEVIQEINKLNDSNAAVTPQPSNPGERVAHMPGGGEFMPR